jgi:predicted dehydrogenase
LSTYKVAVHGMGSRGFIHLQGFKDNEDRFELSAISSSSEEKLRSTQELYGVLETYTDIEKMLEEVRPDVFCFATPPSVRLSMVELAARYGVKAIAMEKPVALSMKEAREIEQVCRTHAIQTIVCHQHKYLPAFEQLKQFVRSGAIGEIERVHAKTRGWLFHIGTHFIDYMLWINEGSKAEWVTGHVHGKEKLSDSHSSPDYASATMQFKNGVRGTLECGYLSPAYLGPKKFWPDCRLTVYGTHGYAWAETDGRWAAFTRYSEGKLLEGDGGSWGPENRRLIQAAYTRDLANWLDDPSQTHPCSLDITTHGFEIANAIVLSALDHTRIDLPLKEGADTRIWDRLASDLPELATFSILG